MAIKHTFLAKDGEKTKLLTPTKAIRQKCLECSNFSFAEVERCPIENCALWLFRSGHNPSRQGLGPKNPFGKGLKD